MAETYNPPQAETNQGEDNEQRIDGDGQEVNALRFLGAGAPPAPPPPAITPVSAGVSQPLQAQPPPQAQPPQAPHPPPQASQHPQQPMPTPGGFDYSDPSAYGSMQMPSVPMSGPYGMPGQVPGMMGGGPPMMMMPPYNYMYNPYFMPGPYPSMPSAPSNQSQSQLLAMLNVIRVKDPKFYREWYKKYTAHKRNPDRVPFPQIPGYPNVAGGPGSSQTLPSFGRTRKESSRSSVNGDSFRNPPNDSFANMDYSVVPGGGANTSMMAYSRSHDHRQPPPPQSGRTSVNGDYRPPPEEDYEIDGADMSSLGGEGGNRMFSSTMYHPSDRDRPQTQSGRSSTVGEPFRPGDVYGGYSEQPESMNYDNTSNYGFQPITEQVREPSPRRMTPLKFSTIHCIATISPLGHLIRIKNSGTAMEFLKMKQFVGHLPEYKEMDAFPGPLTPESTHKSTVIQFCHRKIKEARSNTAQIDRKNFILLWEFLILMLCQNGMVVGSDVADMLLEAAQQEEKLAAEVEEVRDVIEGGEGEEEEDGEEVQVPPLVEPQPPEVKPRDEEKLIKEFCEHLLHGHKKAALDFAMDNDLWGYALFFASKMDERSYGHVLARFANGIALNSPLQTLYHIMCGKQPASVTSCADESFGDWKPHLAMLLSNSGYKPEVEHKAILTLGDTLVSRNHRFAAQFCYLMGHEEFRKDSRLGTLLGYSSAADNILEATQMTEVYEFARKLAEPSFSLGVSFLQSKLDYAKQLVSHGFVQEALSYCEEITKTLKVRKIEDAELTVCTNTLQIAERIALADEAGTASTTWVEDLRKLAADPMAFCTDSLRKLSLVSSTHEQGSDRMSVGSQPYQQQQQQQQQQPLSQPKDIYDPYYNNQNQNLAQDVSNSSISQFETAVSSTTTATMSTSDADNTYSGIAEIPQENNWNNASQMNGGLHISATPSMYDVNQQQQQQQQPPQMPMNSISSTNLYNNGNAGNYQPMAPASAYPSTVGRDKLGNQAPTANNNYWYNPYDSQPQPPSVPGNQNAAMSKDQGLSNAAMKKKSVRFEDEHDSNADVESLGNDIQAVIRARFVNKRPDPVELKSAIKCAGDKFDKVGSIAQQKQNCRNGEHAKTSKITETGRYSPESGGFVPDSDDKSLSEVEYKSTYPIDEPIESVLKTAGGSKITKTRSIPPYPTTSFEHSNHKSSKTFPVDKECCDINEPCEDHDYFGDGDDDESYQNGASPLTAQYSGYDDKTDSLARNQLSSGSPSKGEKKKPAKDIKGLDGSEQKGWFSSLFKTLAPKPKNQMKLPDDKNPTIVWDDKEKRWKNTAATDGEDDLAPAGPPPKDSDLMGMGKSGPPMPNGPMSFPPNMNMQSVPPQSANNNLAYQQPPPALNNPPVQSQPTGPYDNGLQYQNGQVQQHNQIPNQPMMMPQHQHQHQQPHQQTVPANDGMMSPGMPPSANNTMNKYKLQKGRSLKNSYVDVLNPNGTRSAGNDAPAPALPLNNMRAPQVPNMFIPPSLPTNQGSDGPVSFLTAPSEENLPSEQQDNSHPQAPPMFNPAQFQGYPQGQ